MPTISLVASLLASFIIIFAAIFVMIKDWRDQIHRYYSFFAVSSFGILFTMFITYAFPESQHLTEINKLTQLSTVFSFASVLCLSLVFPKREDAFPFRYTVLILIPAVVIGGIAVFTDLNIKKAYFQNGVLVREFNYFYTIYAAVAFLYLVLGMGNFIRKYVQTKIEVYRLQMRYVFVGTSIAMLIAAVFSIILPRFIGYADLYVLGPSLASFVGILSLFYSIVSHDMMDIKTAVHKTSMYAIISTVIFIPIYGVITVYDSRLFVISDMPLYIIALAIVVVFIIFSVYIQPLIDRFFKRRQYEFESIIDDFIRDVEKIKDFKSIIQRSVDILFESLFLRNAFFLMFNAEGRRYLPYYTRGEQGDITPLERTSPIVRWFVRNQEILSQDRVYVDDRNFADIRESFTSFFDGNQVKIILPIYHRRTVLGLICLGDKDSLSAYKPDEIVKLQYFQSESNVQISNTLTYEEAMKEQLINRTIDLSSDILSKSIPVTLPNMMGIKFGAFFVPKYGEGIDYFDFIRPGSQGVGVIATDISGVGMNSSLYSVILKSAFQSSLQEASNSYSVIQRLNSALYNYSQGKGVFITGFYFYYDLKSMRLIYSNAGFPALELYRIEKNDFDSLDTEGIPLGYDRDANFGTGRTYLLRGDIGVLYSKALINSKNQKEEDFGLLRLRNIIKENRTGRPAAIAESIQKQFSEFMGISSPESDIVVIVFKIV